MGRRPTTTGAASASDRFTRDAVTFEPVDPPAADQWYAAILHGTMAQDLRAGGLAERGGQRDDWGAEAVTSCRTGALRSPSHGVRDGQKIRIVGERTRSDE